MISPGYEPEAFERGFRTNIANVVACENTPVDGSSTPCRIMIEVAEQKNHTGNVGRNNQTPENGCRSDADLYSLRWRYGEVIKYAQARIIQSIPRTVTENAGQSTKKPSSVFCGVG